MIWITYNIYIYIYFTCIGTNHVSYINNTAKTLICQFGSSKMERHAWPQKSEIKPGRFNFWLKAIKYTSIQYVSISAICGVRYLNEKSGKFYTKYVFQAERLCELFEFFPCLFVSNRMMWFCVVGLSFIFASSLLSMFVKRFLSNPTRVIIETNHKPIGQLDFPMITFCPIHQMTNDRALKLTESL